MRQVNEIKGVIIAVMLIPSKDFDRRASKVEARH